MFTKTNTKYSYLRRLTILPIMAATVLLFAFRNGNINSRPIIKLDKQYTVVIDAGHGGKDLGASAADGTNEKDLTLAIALKVKSLNNNPNINIVLSRESDKFITVMDRTNIANAAKSNLYVSIHMNNDDAKKGTGSSCYVPFKKNLYIKESVVLAKNILEATSGLFLKNKLITTKDKGIWVIENANMPAVLFESGFISNPNDLKLVKENEDKIANMLLEGINTYLSNNFKINADIDTLPKLNATKSDKITVTSKTSVDTVVDVNLNYDLNKDKIVVSNVTLNTSKKQAALDALENKANVVITKKTEGGTEKYVIVENGETASKPTFYLDGIKITEKEMKAISPNDIESVNVLSGEQALKKYPKDGRTGVVEIKLKRKN